MQCDRCGLQSDVEQAFSTEKRLLGRSKYFCPDCTVRRQSGSCLWTVGLLGAAALLFFALYPSSITASMLLEVLLVGLSFIPLILMHELAHAGAAKLLGLRVFGIIIGVGKTTWSGKLFGMNWTVNILPMGGITSVGPRPVPGLRWKLFLIYLAGPASHIVMAFILSLLTKSLPYWSFGYRVLNVLVFANVILFLSNLFPRKVSIATGMQGTDGWHLFRVPFLKQSEITKLHIGYFVGEAIQSYSEYDLDAARDWLDRALALDNNSGIARNVLGIIQMDCGQQREARETFLQLLETEDGKQPGLRYVLLNNVAYLNALLRDSALLPEADELSANALQHLPWIPAIVGTRGTVLIELGRVDEGIDLLKKAMSSHTDKRGKALNACHLAIGEFRRGDLSAAHKYLTTARTLDSRCTLLERVESEIAG